MRYVLSLIMLSALALPSALSPQHSSSSTRKVAIASEHLGSSPLQEPTLRMFASLIGNLPNKTPHSAHAKAQSVRLFSQLYQADDIYLHEVLGVFVLQLRNLLNSVLLRTSTRDKHLILLLEESKHVIKRVITKEELSLNTTDIDLLMQEIYSAISPTLQNFWLGMLKWAGVIGGSTAAIYGCYLLYHKLRDIGHTASQVADSPENLRAAMVDSPFAKEMARAHRKYDALLCQHGYKRGEADVTPNDYADEEPNQAGSMTRYVLSRTTDKDGNPLKQNHKKSDRKILRTPLNLGDALIQFFANPDSHGAKLALQIANEFARVNDADDINMKRFGIDPATAPRIIVRGPAASDSQHEPVGKMPTELRQANINKLPANSKKRKRYELQRKHIIDFQIEREIIPDAESFDDDFVVPPHGYGLGYGLAHGFANSKGHVAQLVNDINILSERMEILTAKADDVKGSIKDILKDKEIVEALENIFGKTVTSDQSKEFLTSILSSPKVKKILETLGKEVGDSVRVFRWGGKKDPTEA